MDLLIPLQASFGDRLLSERVRFWIFIGLAIITFMVVLFTYKRIRLVIAVIAAFGAGWFGWLIYNVITGSKTRLFEWQFKLRNLDDVFSTSSIVPGLLVVVAVAGAVGAWLGSKKSNDNADVPLPFRILATIGVLFGLLLILQPVAEAIEFAISRAS